MQLLSHGTERFFWVSCPYDCCLDEAGTIRSLPELKCTEDVKDLARRLLVVEPTERLRSLTALKRTALFMGFNFETVLEKVVDLKNLTISNEEP
ncbi:hypothetical protein RUM43_005913 [Polyplax serrata]|uniref:Uncharacterized protein n=1 Tax=Polyplax serrata TaxID=468196 RepID=A0AAN8S8U3_POLSC